MLVFVVFKHFAGIVPTYQWSVLNMVSCMGLGLTQGAMKIM